MNRKTARAAGFSLQFLLALLLFVICVYPLVWMVFGSLKTSGEFYTNVWGPPASAQWVNFKDAWQTGKLGEKFLNSIFITGGALLILIPVNCCASYALGRLSFRFKTVIYMLLLSGIMIPAGVLGIPTFTVALRLGLANTRVGLMLVYAAGAISMGVFIMRSFFISLPSALEEAALIDGCNRFQSFFLIILPLAKAGVMTQIVFNGLSIWNEYFMANIMISKPELRTLPLALANFVGQHSVNYPMLFAALTITTIPVIAIYMLTQKGFIEGVSAGAVKG